MANSISVYARLFEHLRVLMNKIEEKKELKKKRKSVKDLVNEIDECCSENKQKMNDEIDFNTIFGNIF